MTSDAVLILRCLFGTIWSLFTSFEVPGTHTTPAEFAIFLLSTVVIIRFLRRVFDVSVNAQEK